MKILTIVGARPQFVKAAAVSRQIKLFPGISEVIVHTGQHFDHNMSEVFFDEMDIPRPDYNLAINSLSHGAMTGRMIEEIEKVLIKERPDWLLVYGDTNSTLAGALAASKLHIKVAHVEAGLRSFNMKMPEEVNRILTDRISDVLFCPTDTAMVNLQKEGFDQMDNYVLNVGDVMYDAALFYEQRASPPVGVNLPDSYILATVHRAENTNDVNKLTSIITAFNRLQKEGYNVVLPLHPRTKQYIIKYALKTHFTTLEPVGYLQMVHLIKNCSMVMTDSGGLQKEAYFFKKPCLTLRDQTEWVELVNIGSNVLIDVSQKIKIVQIVKRISKQNYLFNEQPYGEGNATKIIIETLIGYQNKPVE